MPLCLDPNSSVEPLALSGLGPGNMSSVTRLGTILTLPMVKFLKYMFQMVGPRDRVGSTTLAVMWPG